MYIDERKKKYFISGMSNFMFSSVPQAWKQEQGACDCYSEKSPCYDSECPYRGRFERYPADIGGQGQCLRLAQLHSPFAFRNVDGRVIELPFNVVQKIIDSFSN